MEIDTSAPVDIQSPVDSPMAEAAKAIDVHSQPTKAHRALIQNAQTSHDAASRYESELERILAVVAKLQAWIRDPPAQPSATVTTKFLRPLAVKILEINDLHAHLRLLRQRNASDLARLDSLDSPHRDQSSAETVNDVVTANLRHLNETASFVISPLVERLRSLHVLVRSGKSGLGLQRGVPKTVATELDRLRFQAEVVDGWTIAFENFWVAGGGAVVDLERRA